MRVEEQAHVSLGSQGLPAAHPPRPTHAFDLRVRGGLPRAGDWRRHRAGGPQRSSHAASSRRDRHQGHTGHSRHSSSIKPDGTVPSNSEFAAIFRSCRCHRVPPNSTAKRIPGSSCARTGYRTRFGQCPLSS